MSERVREYESTGVPEGGRRESEWEGGKEGEMIYFWTSRVYFFFNDRKKRRDAKQGGTEEPMSSLRILFVCFLLL